MDSMDQKVKGYLSSLDKEPYCKINDFEVSQKIGEIIKPFNQKPVGDSLYELLAFDLFPRHEEQLSEWGTYFGSKMAFRKEEDNSMMEYPSIQQITKDPLE